MPSRAYWIPALILWFASTGWLISTKILPALTAGNPPDYGELLPKSAVTDPEPIRWTIRWNGKNIGWAENKITRSFDGTGKIANEVNFQQLPVDEMVRDIMGVLGRFAGPLTAEIGPLDMHVMTNLDFDNYGALSQFTTTVDIGEMEELLKIDGFVNGDKLDLAARVKPDNSDSTEIYRKKEIKLPPDALVADTFSPRPKMANLRVGQTWTFQSYQPLMPHNPLTLIEAKVEGEELVEWNGKMTRARKVVFRKDSGSGISSTRRPVSETWVTFDGTVLRQDLWIANVKVQFVRDDIASKTDKSQEESQSNKSPQPIELKSKEAAPSL